MSSDIKSAQVIERPWTWRRCLLWCLPALLVGTILRVSFLAAIPEAYYGSDSNSYFSTALQFYEKHRVEVEPKRKWLYPLLLLVAPPLPGSTPQTVAVLQHALGLLTIFGIGWIAGCVGQARGPTALGATLLAAVWPRMLWYEHEIIAESVFLALFVGAMCCVFPLRNLSSRKHLFWAIVAIGALAITKPHGRPLWLVFMTLLTLQSWRFFRWPHLVAIAASVGLIATSGSDKQGAWILLSTNLPLVKTEGSQWAEYRNALRPVVEHIRQDPIAYVYDHGNYEKALKRSRPTPEFGPVWASLSQDDALYEKVATSLAIEGIRSSPLGFLQIVTSRIGFALSTPDSTDDFPLQHFWDQQVRRNIEHRDENPKDLPFLYEKSYPEIDTMIAQRRLRTLWFEPYLPAAEKLATWMTLTPPSRPGLHNTAASVSAKWTGILAVLGMVALAGRRQWRALLWLAGPLFFQMLAIFSVGNGLTRFLLPLDWIGLIFMVLAVDGFVLLGSKVLAKLRPADRLPNPE